MSGTLYLIATPIGNLEDITLRAIRLLKECDLVACEDTRQTSKLLSHLGISKPTVSCHEHNEQGRAAELVERLNSGDNIALVSDAGTPLVSDPGYRIVRAAIDAGIRVVPVPGPSALIAALSASGFSANSFRFGGFLPQKSNARRELLASCADSADTLIFYEAPHRLLDALLDIGHSMEPSREIVVARELTKIYEEFVRGSARHVFEEFSRRPSVKGEQVILIGPKAAGSAESDVTTEQLAAELAGLEAEGTSRMEAMKVLARRHGVGKRDVYARLTAPRTNS
jgi:16S rRNA (cytidine1402-2'-O)-methyltransferase